MELHRRKKKTRGMKDFVQTLIKKVFAVLALVLLSWGTCQAQEPTPGQRWIEQADGGFVFPVSPSAGRNYSMGVGGDILVGYRLTRSFSLGVGLGYYDCDERLVGGMDGEWIYTSLMGVARYSFGTGAVRPYLFLGAGLAFNYVSLTPSSGPKITNPEEVDPLLSPGVGILFIVQEGLALFIQSRVDMDFTSSLSGLGSDNPAFFIPIKMGISVFPQ